jgi:hypothetical protein
LLLRAVSGVEADTLISMGAHQIGGMVVGHDQMTVPAHE